MKPPATWSLLTFFGDRYRAVIHTAQVAVAGKTARNGLLTGLLTAGCDHFQAVCIAGQGAALHLGAKQIQNASIGADQFIQQADVINIHNAALAHMADKPPV